MRTRFAWAVLAGALGFSAPAAALEPSFRIRSDAEAPLNADAGWAARTGEAAAVLADQPFRLRMEASQGGAISPLYLQVRRNDGAWETLEAHDFPYPERDLTLSFEDAEPGTAPSGWRRLSGGEQALQIVEEGAQRVLRLDGGASGLAAVHPAPWGPSADITLAAQVRFPDPAASIALLLGVQDRSAALAVHFSADGGVRILDQRADAPVVLAEARTALAPGAWHAIEAAAEDGALNIEINGEAVYAGAFSLPEGEAGLAAPAGSRADFAEIAIEGVARAPQASIVSTRAYAHGDATSDLLAGAGGAFTPGGGISLRDRAEGAAADAHAEYEWPLVIRRYADGPTVSEHGDRFTFRMVDAAGAAVSSEATVVLTVPAGHLGGTFVETPGRIGPWQASDGSLYFIMEPSETDNKFMMMKSEDAGRTWREVDGENRPQTGDLEAVDSRLAGDRIEIVHQVTRSVRRHVFRTSDHPTHPDSWESRDELAAEARALAQMAAITPRPDGSLLTVFLADRLHYAIRSPDGVWSAPVELDPGIEVVNAGPQAVLGRDGAVHLSYFTDDGRIWLRRLSADGALGERRLVADGAGSGRSVYGAVLPLAYDAAADRLTMAYRLADGSLWERALTAGGALSEPIRITPGPVVTDAVDSQQAGADLLITDGRLIALFIDEATRSLFRTEKTNGVWSEPVLLASGVDAAWVRGAAVRGAQGERLIGYVFDAGSHGGTGLNRYGAFVLEAE